MAAKTPPDMSNEELLKNEKALKISVTMTVVSCIFIFATGIYLLLAKSGKINVFLFLPLTFAAIGIMNYKNLQAIRREKAARSL